MNQNEALTKRIRNFYLKTRPMLDWFEQETEVPVVSINAFQSPDDVHDEIVEFLETVCSP